jgi:hypothetical protein
MNCPNCDRLLYSRIHPKCGHCGIVLPPEWRLPADEIEKIREEQAEIEARRVVAKEKDEEEREAQIRRDRGNSSHVPPGFML